MNRRSFLTSLATGLATAPLWGREPTPPKPNVLFFLVDDMGWSDCGAYGSTWYETPAIDAFAKEATRFTDAYACPLCSPTRATLLTGLYNFHHGITTASGHKPPGKTPTPLPLALPPAKVQNRNYLAPEFQTSAEILKGQGWRTAHLGKWHVGLESAHWPEKQGFDKAFHCHPDPGPPSYFSPYGVKPPGTSSTRGEKVGTITDGPPGEYITDRLTDEACRLIREPVDTPFFINLWHYGVHGPWGHKEAYTSRHALRKDPRGIQGNPIMASMLQSIDESLARILSALQETGKDRNTLIIFNSDNGGNTHSNLDEEGDDGDSKKKTRGTEDWDRWAKNQPPTRNTPLRDGKGTLYEGGVRVPLMWRWKGVLPPGQVRSEVVGAVDFLPTVCDLLNLPVPRTVDGQSYAMALRGETAVERPPHLIFFPHQKNGGGIAVRRGPFKLIRWFGRNGKVPPMELYDLGKDLGEGTNLAGQRPDVVTELNHLLETAFFAKSPPGG